MGSEMCIRDSQYNQWVANQTLEDYALRFTAKSARRWSAARVANTCLLYTSDAADDLLCVDLGGRRIIKKQNQHNTSHRPTTNSPITTT